MKIKDKHKEQLYSIVKYLTSEFDIVGYDVYNGIANCYCIFCGHNIENYEYPLNSINHKKECIYLLSIQLVDEIEEK